MIIYTMMNLKAVNASTSVYTVYLIGYAFVNSLILARSRN